MKIDSKFDMIGQGTQMFHAYWDIHESGIRGCICNDLECDYEAIKSLKRIRKSDMIDGGYIMTYAFEYYYDTYIVLIFEHLKNENCTFYYLRLA